MGWKTINGRRYYYKSRRVGSRVESTYFGAGESGSLMAEIDANRAAGESAPIGGREQEEREECRRGRTGLG